MNIETMRRVLLWCTVINYGILLVWFLFFVLAHDSMHQFHGRWFDLSVDQFDMLSLRGDVDFQDRDYLIELGPIHCSAHNQARKVMQPS
jgi:hypothetical protein